MFWVLRAAVIVDDAERMMDNARDSGVTVSIAAFADESLKE